MDFVRWKKPAFYDGVGRSLLQDREEKNQAGAVRVGWVL